MQLAFALLVVPVVVGAAPQDVPDKPLARKVDLDIGESQEIELWDATKAQVKLLDVQETRDSLRLAIREARVKVEVNGQVVDLTSATYHLPVTIAGVQIDCP